MTFTAEDGEEMRQHTSKKEKKRKEKTPKGSFLSRMKVRSWSSSQACSGSPSRAVTAVVDS